MASRRQHGQDTADQSIDFQWVILEQPADAHKRDYHRKVRSHVTKLQHRRAQLREKPRVDSSTEARVTRNYVTDVYSSDNHDVLPSTTRPFPRGEESFKVFALRDADNVVGEFLADLKLDVATALGYYERMVKVQSKDFEKQYGLASDYESWRKFIAFIYRDPVLLTVAILVAVRHVSHDTGLRLNHGILKAECFLIRSVNAALEDPKRNTSGPLLVTVAICASYELLFGSRQAYHMHMNGLLRMIGMRGGPDDVAREDLDTLRMLVWHDAHSSSIAGCRRYLNGDGILADHKMFMLEDGY